MTKYQKLDKMQALLRSHGVEEFDAEVLAEDLYSIANERGGNFAELEERVVSLEDKVDTMSKKLDTIGKRLG